MRLSTIQGNKAARAGAVIFWIAVWAVAAAAIGEELFLPSPLSVCRSLMEALPEASFWSSVLFTLSRILAGFLVSAAAACCAAALSYRLPIFSLLMGPLVRIIRATPVASIVILVLVWVRSSSLSVVISFLMVFPIIYTNLLEGLGKTDRDLLEAAAVYRMKAIRKIRYVYIPSVQPFMDSAIRTSLGLAWKSGIAAEVIGLPDGSIGERLYEAKIYLDTPELFAWTAAVIALAFAFEHLFLLLSRLAAKAAVS